MSINIGFKNNSYSIDRLSQGDQFIINTYNNSNAIIMNIDNGTSQDAVINFRNKFITGIKDNKYVIYDVENTKSLVEHSSSNISLNTNLSIRDQISISSNLTTLNSNILCVLKNQQDTFKIKNRNNKLLLEVNENNAVVDSVKIGNTLYVDKIVNNLGNRIEITNPTIVGLVLQSFNTEQSINVNNILNQYYNTPTVSINRYDNSLNIMEIGTCNIWEPKINKQFIIDRKGMVGIGAKQPEAPLHISQIIPDNPFVFKFQGDSSSDVVNITTKGTIGIGTNVVNGLMHIHRDDVHTNELNNSVPILRLDMNYDPLSNISYNSNIVGVLNKITKAGVLNYTSDFIFTGTIQNNVNTCNFYNKFYIMNTDMQSNYNLLSYSTCNIYINFPYNIQYVHSANRKHVYISENIVYYPSSLYTSETSIFSQNTKFNIEHIVHSGEIQNNITSNTSNFVTSHYLNHNIIMMSRETYDYAGYVSDIANVKYNADKFTSTTLVYSNLNGYYYSLQKPTEYVTSNIIGNIYYNINLIMEDIDHKIKYKLQNDEKILDAPYFLYASSNNNFKASLSSYGTLSLGSPEVSNIYYEPNKYVLYADGLSYIRNAEIDEITSSNSYIKFNNNNISNINTIHAQSNIIEHFSYLNDVNANNINVINQTCSDLNVSNINTSNINTFYSKMTSSNIHFTTYFSIGKHFSNMQISNNTLTKIVVDYDLTSNNDIYKHYKGLTITNEKNIIDTPIYDRINPSISISGYDGSIPYINLSRENTEYFFRINNKVFSSENTDILELCCDNVSNDSNRTTYFNSTSSQPSFLNHIKKYNILTFGELHNVCVECRNNLSTQSNSSTVLANTFTNATNKIALGFPYGELNSKGYAIKDWPIYFNSNMVLNTGSENQYTPNMLNIFGNIGVFTINGKPVMTIQSDDGKQRYISSQENPAMYFEGTITASSTISQNSDSNIKTDLQIIENALEKVNTLNGYSYTNVLTSNRCIGLVAQEVQQVFPELVSKNNNLLSLSYGNMIGVVVESIKELSLKLDGIDKRLKTIEDKMST